MRSNGENPLVHIAESDEYRNALIDKLREEVEEYTVDHNPEEIADILEVIEAICINENFSKVKIKNIQVKKRRERGSFKDRIILSK